MMTTAHDHARHAVEAAEDHDREDLEAVIASEKSTPPARCPG